MDKAKSLAGKAKERVDKWLSSREHRPIEHEWEEILARYDVVFQQYYTMTLVGEHIHRLCTDRHAIMEESRELMLRGLAEGDPLREEIVQVIDQLEELLECFDYICSVMTRMEIQPPEVIISFRKVAKYCGEVFRSYLGVNGTPKLHCLEVHISDLLENYKRCGIFGEDPVEREHHINKMYAALFKSMKNWPKLPFRSGKML